MFNLNGKTDSQIQSDVSDELDWDPKVDSNDLEVKVHNGIVTLSGTVPHFFDRLSAAKSAEKVSGVRAVADEIRVHLKQEFERSDEDLTKAVLSTLKWNYNIPQGLKAIVDHGTVTLDGVASQDCERVAAAQAVSQLMGVKEVINNISLFSDVHAADVQIRVEDALKRTAKEDGQDIRVFASGHEVTLSGDVHSLAEIEDASFAAWNSPGVTNVINHLELRSQ